jgi:hypothetical protein
MEHCKISNSKHQISGYQMSGVREKIKQLKPETSSTDKAIELLPPQGGIVDWP